MVINTIRWNTLMLSLILGSKYGLQLILNVEQYEYMKGPSSNAGVQVIIRGKYLTIIKLTSTVTFFLMFMFEVQ